MALDQLLNELCEVVDELCDVIEELGYVKAQKSDERFTLEAKRDILTERKYLIVRLIDAKQEVVRLNTV